MKNLLLIVLLFTVCSVAKAQNWQTVRLHDTEFYNAGRALLTFQQHYSGASLDTNLLRTMWVDSAALSGADSIFYFFRGLRADSAHIDCVDLAAPSWLGPKMIRRPDGTELYVNSNGDTITFRTTASIGASWMLARDMAGNTFQATVTSAGPELVDGISDSVKTILVQAFNGGNPVADPYNGTIFRISKSYGWLKAMDLFRFPNKSQFSTAPYAGYPLGLLHVDSLPHERLPKRFANWDVQHINLAWRYAPGNEYITEQIFYTGSRGGEDYRVVTYDSVIRSVLLASDRIAVTFLTKRYSWKKHYAILSIDSTYIRDTTATYIYADTIRTDTGSKQVRSFPLYESAPVMVGQPFVPPGFNGPAVDTLCNGKLSFEAGRFPVVFGHFGNCWLYRGYYDSWQSTLETYVEDFGPRRIDNHYEGTTTYSKIYAMEITYAKLPDCGWGKKIDVLTLAMNPNTPPANTFLIYPNPVSSQVSLASPPDQLPVRITLRSITGQSVRQLSSTAVLMQIPTSDLESGLYFLELAGNNIRQIVKVQIQH